jgi:CubicO group peptidase (beta-lactamase class C family)
MSDIPASWFQRHKLLTAVILVVLAAIILAAINYTMLRRLWFNATIWMPGDHVEDLRTFDELMPSRTIKRAGPVFEFGREPRDLPATYEYSGETRELTDFLKRTDTTGFIVIQDDKILFEEYYRGNGPDTLWMTFSASKAYVSALAGIALEEDLIEDLNDPLTKYAPVLKGSGFDGATVDHALRMTTGARWNENDISLTGDLVRMGITVIRGASFDKWLATLPRAHPPGTIFNYSSADTQALGSALVGAIGMSISEYLEQKLWSKMGMESDAYWVTDEAGMEMALSGLNATLRDYARFGRLYLHEGNWNGEQLIPAEWVHKTTLMDASMLEFPGVNQTEESFISWYQWYVPLDRAGDYTALGSFGQFIYVHPEARVIIAKTSAFSNPDEEFELLEEHYPVFRTIAEALQIHRIQKPNPAGLQQGDSP